MLIKNVEFWDKSVEEMTTMDAFGMYPPRIILDVYPNVQNQATKAIFNFNHFEPHEALLTTEEGEL